MYEIAYWIRATKGIINYLYVVLFYLFYLLIYKLKICYGLCFIFFYLFLLRGRKLKTNKKVIEKDKKRIEN